MTLRDRNNEVYPTEGPRIARRPTPHDERLGNVVQLTLPHIFPTLATLWRIGGPVRLSCVNPARGLYPCRCSYFCAPAWRGQFSLRRSNMTSSKQETASTADVVLLVFLGVKWVCIFSVKCSKSPNATTLNAIGTQRTYIFN